MIKPKECPFCFSTEDYYIYIVNESGWSKGMFYVYCDNCRMRGATKYSEEEAIEAWNELRNVSEIRDNK